MGSRWMDAAKRVPLSGLAGHLGMTIGRNRSMGPCPACNEGRRGAEDKRPPVGPSGDQRGWRCHRCGAGGDGIELVALKVLGRSCKTAQGDDFSTLKAWFSERGLLSGVDTGAGGRPAVHSTASMVDRMLGKKRGSGAPQERSRSRSEPRPAEQPKTSQGRRGGRFQWRTGMAEQCAEALWGDGDAAGHARVYLIDHRKIPENTLKAFGIGLFIGADGEPVHSKQGRPYLTIPLMEDEDTAVNLRFRSVPVVDTCEHCSTPLGCRKCKEYRVCEGRPLTLFGLQFLDNDLGAQVFITEGELDVLAMHAYGYKKNVVSGTAGASADWKEKWLDQLEPYTGGFVGLYDDDEAGEAGWTKLSETLGVYRCSRAKLPHNDAGECLMKGVERERIERALGKAESMTGLNIRKVDYYADQLEILINNPELLRGAPTGSARLDEALGGWRPGVVILTGETSDGKTTFGTWVMKQQAALGYPGLITSFEQTPIGTVQKLIRAEVGGDFTLVSKDDRLDALERLGELPLHILDHYGHLPPVKLVEMVRYAKRRYGCTRFLLDHLGFLADPDADDERRAIEAVVRALAILAYTEDVILFLVAHPHNTPQQGRGFQRVTMRNLKGASAIRQDADTVIVVTKELPMMAKGRKVKRPWPQTRLWLEKVRSDFGLSGAEVALSFDPGSCVFADEWSQTPAGRRGLLVPGAKTVRENRE